MATSFEPNWQLVGDALASIIEAHCRDEQARQSLGDAVQTMAALLACARGEQQRREKEACEIRFRGPVPF